MNKQCIVYMQGQDNQKLFRKYVHVSKNKISKNILYNRVWRENGMIVILLNFLFYILYRLESTQLYLIYTTYNNNTVSASSVK